MDWRDIPSLSALRAFEAAVRHGSHSGAAREMNVTHAAIAQHVRALEAHFGQPLMRRDGRGVTATEAGRRLAADLARGFGDIVAGVRALNLGAETRPLSVTTTPSFAENWLMPRLAAFWAAHPEIALTVTADPGVQDLRREGHVLAIRCGQGRWPGLEVERLTSARTVAVAHPDLARRVGVGGSAPFPTTLAGIRHLPWAIDTNYREFLQWFIADGIDPDTLKRTDLGSNAMVLAACRSGVGASIQPMAIVEQDIADGRLVVLAEQPDEHLAYYLVRLPGAMSPRLKIFVTWLKRNL
jgi:LysR family glycine cleavage system transcriptional activator